MYFLFVFTYIQDEVTKLGNMIISADSFNEAKDTFIELFSSEYSNASDLKVVKEDSFELLPLKFKDKLTVVGYRFSNNQSIPCAFSVTNELL